MTRRILAIVALTVLAAAFTAVALAPDCPGEDRKGHFTLPRNREDRRPPDDQRQVLRFSTGVSTVTFGERRVTTPSPTGNKRWAPCAKKARVISWGRRSITVRVPSMAPGAHKVYVTVRGRSSNSRRFNINAVTVVRGRTFSTASQYGNMMGADNGADSDLSGYTRNVLFENCTFEATNPNILGDQAGVLTLGRAAKNYNLTFRDCTFKRNQGAGSGGSGWGGVNGVKSIYGVHDITFEGCTFEEFSRFSIEVWSNDERANRPYNFAVLDSVFEPAGSQCISWSGGRNPLYSIVDGCRFKGYGTDPDRLGEPAWSSPAAPHRDP